MGERLINCGNQSNQLKEEEEEEESGKHRSCPSTPPPAPSYYIINIKRYYHQHCLIWKSST